MPLLARCFIRAALLYLLLGFGLGLLILSQKGIGWPGAWTWRLLPAHVEILLLGWVTQLAMGVAFWILPRVGGRRGDPRPAWLAFGLINGGLLLAVASSLLPALAPYALAARLLETLAVAAFALHAWPRVRPVATTCEGSP
jgi:heme/copper-type cytochrome/quinol oxidase subunit 1